MRAVEPKGVVESHLSVKREDIARAKSWIIKTPGGATNEMVGAWLSEQSLREPEFVETDQSDCEEKLIAAARVYSVRLAFYQAIWELIATGELFPEGDVPSWTPSLELRTPGHRGGAHFDIRCVYPVRVHRPPCAAEFSADTDIFLKGVGSQTIHPGIMEAIQQSLVCFRRGLYMPSIAMLAAAAEATWIECGRQVATSIGDSKLERAIADSFSSLTKKVREVHKSLEQPRGKQLLKTAKRTAADIDNAELWTTTLRERRNALHWTKTSSFIAEHSEAATFLMGAPQHIGTLEAIRTA
jgi:hypothetical protein